MTIGEAKSDKNKRSVCLLAAATATSAAPTLVTDGVPCYPTTTFASDTGICYPNQAALGQVICVGSSAGSGTMAVTLRLWGYLAALLKWVPIGTGGDTTKGTLNEGSSIGETSADNICHSEPLYLGGAYDRLYLQVVAISGTSTAIDAWIVTPMGDA